MRYKVEIPSRPVAKGRARVPKGGGVPYMPAMTARAENWVRLCVVQEVGTPRLEGPIGMRVEFVMPIPRSWSKAKQTDAREGRLHPTNRPDYDNMAKLVSDALNGIAWADDSQVVDARQVKRYGDTPCTIVEWWTLPGGGPGKRQEAPGAALAAGLL